MFDIVTDCFDVLPLRHPLFPTNPGALVANALLEHPRQLTLPDKPYARDDQRDDIEQEGEDIIPKLDPKESKQGKSKRRQKSRSKNNLNGKKLPAALPWTEGETEAIIMQIEFLASTLRREFFTQDFPNFRQAGKRLLRDMTLLIENGSIHRDDIRLETISRCINEELRVLDLDLLLSHLTCHSTAGELLDGQDVILLCGNTGAGKTTTLHILASSSFVEKEMNGFIHYQPTYLLDSTVEDYRTSCSQTFMTKRLQPIAVESKGRSYVVCDTPGFGAESVSLEEDLACGLGMVRAIHRAKTVRPVVVMSRETLGHRFKNFPDTVTSLLKRFSLDDSNDNHRSNGHGDPERLPLNYIFTKFVQRHTSCLHRQFSYVRDHPNYVEQLNAAQTRSNSDDVNKETSCDIGSPACRKLLNDIIRKTTPEAKVVFPIEESPSNLLTFLTKDPRMAANPKKFLLPFASASSMKALEVQLKLSLYGLQIALTCEDYSLAMSRMFQLLALANVLPESKETANLANKATMLHASTLWTSFVENIGKKDYTTAIARMQQSLRLAEALPNTHASECMQQSHELLWESLLESMERHFYCLDVDTVVQLSKLVEKFPDARADAKRGVRELRDNVRSIIGENGSMHKTSILAAAHMLRQLVTLSSGFPEARIYSDDLFQTWKARMTRKLNSQDFDDESLDEVIELSRLKDVIPEAKSFAPFAIRTFKKAFDKAMELGAFRGAVELLKKFYSLAEVYPRSEKYAKQGLDQLWKRFGQAIEHRDYSVAVSILKHIKQILHPSPSASELVQLGEEVFRDRLFRTIAHKNYKVASILIEHLMGLEEIKPFSGELLQTSHPRKVEEREVVAPRKERFTRKSQDNNRFTPREVAEFEVVVSKEEDDKKKRTTQGRQSPAGDLSSSMIAS